MSDFIPQDVKDASDKLTSNWLKGSSFEGEGLVLQVAKPMEKVPSKYGAEEDDYLVENNILEKGQSFRYTFNDAEGRERKIDSCSTPFFIGFKQVEELGVGDWVKIVRTGKTDKTRYTVTKVDAPANAISRENTENGLS
jgi:hypothetical protein